MQYSILENENLEGVAPNLIHKKKIFSYFTVQLVQLANFLHKTTVYVMKYDVNSSLNINYIQQKTDTALFANLNLFVKPNFRLHTTFFPSQLLFLPKKQKTCLNFILLCSYNRQGGRRNLPFQL